MGIVVDFGIGVLKLEGVSHPLKPAKEGNELYPPPLARPKAF